MTSLLDRLVELIVDGEGEHVVFTELEETCRYPLLAATTGYRRGCRCDRCQAGKWRPPARSYHRSHLANRYAP